MQMKARVYLDTSVVSAFYDERAISRMSETQEFWDRLAEFEVSVSSLVREEIEQTTDVERRAAMLRLLEGLGVEKVTDEMRELARAYVENGVFGESMYTDALHVALAVLTRQDILVSWNFKHLVNRRKRAQIDQLNISRGLPTIEIVAPSEL